MGVLALNSLLARLVVAIGLGPKAVTVEEKGQYAVQLFDGHRWRVVRHRYAERESAELAAFDSKCRGIAARVRRVAQP